MTEQQGATLLQYQQQQQQWQTDVAARLDALGRMSGYALILLLVVVCFLAARRR